MGQIAGDAQGTGATAAWLWARNSKGPAMADTNYNGAAGPEPVKTGAPDPTDELASAPLPIEDDEAGGDAGSPTGPRGEADVDVTFTPDEPGGDPIRDDLEKSAAINSAAASGKSGSGHGTGEAKQSTVQLLKSEAGKLGEEAGTKARSLAGDGKDRATAKLGEFSQMLHDAADTVDEKLGEQYGRYARDAADRVSGFADQIAEKDVDELIDDLRGFVRASPAIAIGTAAAAGFVLARILRSGVEAAGDRRDA